MIFAITIGFFCGAFVAFHVSRWLVGYMSRRMARDDHQRRFMRSVAIIFGAISLAPTIFFTVMAGAVINRSGAADLELPGFGAAGIPVALALALVAMITVIVATAAVAGAAFGYLAARK